MTNLCDYAKNHGLVYDKLKLLLLSPPMLLY